MGGWLAQIGGLDWGAGFLAGLRIGREAAPSTRRALGARTHINMVDQPWSAFRNLSRISWGVGLGAGSVGVSRQAWIARVRGLDCGKTEFAEFTCSMRML